MTLLSHADYERIAANLSYPTEAFIGGTFAPALSGETMPTVNPATGKEIARVASCGREDVDKAVAAARKAFESGAWSRMHPSERKKILMRFIGLIKKHQVELAVLESLDSGKPVRECLLTDLPETIECLEWHAECADKQYGGISPSGDGRLGLIVREPAGVVACVLPWNFPLMMVGWKLGPALAEGNSVILKPASVTSLSTLKLAEFAAEAGEYTWNSSSEPTIFQGGLEGLEGSWETLKRRFAFGGDTAKDQRVYFFNLKELVGNKYGTPAPIPFRVVDNNIGLDMDVSIRCNGEYSYKIADPMLFYKNVCGNVSQDYTRDQLDSQLKSEFLTALQPAFARISAQGIRYSALPGHTMELAQAMNEVLSGKWGATRGLAIVAVGVNSVTASAEDEATIKELQKSAVFRNTNMAAAHMVQAQAEAMKTAAGNKNGAMMGFMGMNMAQSAGGFNAASLFQMGQQQPAAPAPAAPAAPAAGANTWKCSCGAVNTGKFCVECGASKPADGWVCSCGAVNKGKFCSECGAKKPASEPLYRCDKCGWEPEDPRHPPKFCPECGDKFDDEDIR